MIEHAYVSLGSNVGDRAGFLLLAVRGMFDANLAITRLSSIYETEPVESCTQPLFLNMVAQVSVGNLLTAEQMMARLLRVEYALGRTREVPKGPRTIDLDLLLFKREIRNTEFLKLPHPRLPYRRFVLTPLVELVPQLLHPTLHKSIAELLGATVDDTQVNRWLP